MSAKHSVAQLGAVTERPEAQRDSDGLSPQMRRLISTFGGVDSGRTWDPDAFARRSSAPVRRQPDS